MSVARMAIIVMNIVMMDHYDFLMVVMMVDDFVNDRMVIVMIDYNFIRQNHLNTA
jgi:hypothetical protein